MAPSEPPSESALPMPWLFGLVGLAFAAKAAARRDRVAARRKEHLCVQNDKKNAMDKEKMERIARRRAQKTAEQRQMDAKKQAQIDLDNMRKRRIAKKQARAASPNRPTAAHA